MGCCKKNDDTKKKAIFQDLPTGERHGRSVDEKAWECVVCGTGNEKDARFCKKCGNDRQA